MNAKDQLKKVKVLLGLEVKLETMKLDNGTVLEAESFEAGQEVFVIADEDKVAVPVGEYTLEDGKTLVVSEEGIIGEIKEGEAEEEAPAEEQEATEEVEAEEVVAEETEEEETKEEEKEVEYATKEEVAELKALVEKLMSEKQEDLSEEPTEDPKEETELTEEVAEEIKEEEVELSEETPEETKEDTVVELSAEEIESAEPFVHNPEVTLSKQSTLLAKPSNKLGRIYRKLNSK